MGEGLASSRISFAAFLVSCGCLEVGQFVFCNDRTLTEPQNCEYFLQFGSWEMRLRRPALAYYTRSQEKELDTRPFCHMCTPPNVEEYRQLQIKATT